MDTDSTSMDVTFPSNSTVASFRAAPCRFPLKQLLPSRLLLPLLWFVPRVTSRHYGQGLSLAGAMLRRPTLSRHYDQGPSLTGATSSRPP